MAAASLDAPPCVRVLIADDHPVVRAGLAGLLAQEAGFIVVGQASDGAEAVAMSRAERPDVVLMDVRMPVVDGITATEQIMSEHPTIRVIVLSSLARDADVRRAFRAGARGFMMKDALLSDLVTAVRTVHGGRRFVAHSVAAVMAEFPFEADLTEREREVLSLVARGMGNKAIAAALERSDETIKGYLRNIFTKLGVDDRTSAVTVALSRGILQLDP
jgi:DNA-binding NarL/FixJ family response regulator